MKNNKRNLYISLIIILMLCVAIGYATLNSTLNINGKSNISKNTWNVYFDNVNVKTNSVKAVKTPVIENQTKVDFEVVLNLPGDFYEFNVDVVNGGSIDAMIDSFEKIPDLTEEQKKYLNYTITYENNKQIIEKQLVNKNSYVRLKVRVEYKKDIVSSELPTLDETLNLGFTINYIQADGTGVSVNNNGELQVSANGDINEIGTIVTIGDQQFYTIGTEGNNLKLFSMMNITFDEYPVQSLDYGKIEMYDFDSVGVEHFNNYKLYLENQFDVELIEIRLITIYELTDSNTIACEFKRIDEYGYDATCENSPYSWIYSTNHYIIDDAWHFVSSDGDIGNSPFDTYGIRPVIVISKDYF